MAIHTTPRMAIHDDDEMTRRLVKKPNKEPASAALRPLVLAVRFVEVLSHASAQRASTAGQDTSRKKH